MRSLTLKLTLAFLGVSLTGIALVALMVWSFTSFAFNRFLTDRGLSDYTNTVTNYYKTNGSWTGIADYLHKQGVGPTAVQAGKPQDGNRFDPPLNDNQGANLLPPWPFVLVDQNGQVLVTTGSLRQGEKVAIQRFSQNEAITVDNQVVGYVLLTGRTPRPDRFESQFLTRMNQALILAALGAISIAVLLGLILARSITRPVRELTIAASALAQGQLNQQVRVRSKDELGELTKTFNKMSADLQRANQLRRQMTADIAHDLRTPLAVITGYLEGLKDGVVKPSPKRFTAMHDEALFLQRLVEDLRILSLADAGELSINRQPVQPGEVIERLAESFQHQAEQNQIKLKTVIEDDLPSIQIDPERMLQALSNLVSNAIRYTPAGGEITLSASRLNDRVRIEVRDTGSGIDSGALPHIFDRFYRADDSRQEEGSGLGLAIAKSIVELQGGKITAASDGPGMGSLFSIQMPG